VSHASTDLSPVHLKLGLAWTSKTHPASTATRPTATGLTRQVSPRTSQPRQTILVLGQLYLELALPGSRMLGKNVQNQTGPIEELDILTERFFEIPQLAGREFVIKDDHIAVQILAQIDQLFDLTRADQSGSMKALQSLPCLSRHLKTGCACQLGQFAQRILNVPAAPLVLQLCAYEQSTLSRRFGFDQCFSDSSPQ
jgi:hypothetical protein